jgi:hypothetical protein
MLIKLTVCILSLWCGLAIQAEAGRALVESRMKTIIFEELDFRSISFTNAVEYLRLQSRALDPQKKGINMILKTDGGANPSLSLMLGKTSLYRALKLITEVAEYRWRFIGNTLILEPRPKVKPKRAKSGTGDFFRD